MLEGVDVEIMLPLRPFEENYTTSSDVWDQWKIFSWTEDVRWVEHCRGLIAALDDRKRNAVERFDATNLARLALQDQVRKIEALCASPVESKQIYQEASNIGIKYGSYMTKLNGCRVGDNRATGLVEIPETASSMPHNFEIPYVVHPALLENCFQISWPLLGAGQGKIYELYLPKSIKHLSVRPKLGGKSGDHYQVFGASSVAQSSPERLIESILVIDPDQANHLPVIKIESLIMMSLCKATSVREKREKSMCLKVQWEPCLDLLGPNELPDYFQLEEAPHDEIKRIKLLEQASIFYLDAALNTVTDSHYTHSRSTTNGSIDSRRSSWQLQREGKTLF
jgi:hypothetical protein